MTFILIDVDYLLNLQCNDDYNWYLYNIWNVLLQCNPPYTFLSEKTTSYPFLQEECLKNHILHSHNTQNFSFKNILCDLVTDKGPIDLYIFSCNNSPRFNIESYQQFLEEHNVQIRNVKLYFLGSTRDINLNFIVIFQKFLQDVYLNFDYKGHISPHFDFKDMDYAFLMKDDSIKLHILSKLISNNANRNDLRETLYQFYVRFLNENFADDKINPFYVEDNVQGCVEFIQNYSEDQAKTEFCCKMNNILKMLNYDIGIFSSFILRNDESYFDIKNKYCIDLYEKCELLPIDILYKNGKMMIFPVQLHKLENESYTNYPFYFSDIIVRISDNVNFEIIDPESYQTFKKIYDTDPTENKQLLQNVYILNNGILPFQDVVNHNNAILIKLYPYLNTSNECMILRHMAFLYVLGMQKFPEIKDRLFEEIRLLGNSSDYFISLHPCIKPLIVDKINAGFWYIAKISDLAFPIRPSDKFDKTNEVHIKLSQYKNLRKLQLLGFYKNVYDQNYIYPSDMISYELQIKFEHKYGILKILTNFYDYETEGFLYKIWYPIYYAIILYNKPVSRLTYMSSVNLETILEHYQVKCGIDDNKRIRQLNVIRDFIKEEEFYNLCLNIRIPSDLFNVTKDLCLGFNLDTNAYFTIFKKYCEVKQCYPKNSFQLMYFIRDYYWINSKMPVLFEPAVKKAFDNILSIFSNITDVFNQTLESSSDEELSDLD